MCKIGNVAVPDASNGCTENRLGACNAGTSCQACKTHPTDTIIGSGASFGSLGDCPTGWGCLPDSDANPGTCYKCLSNSECTGSSNRCLNGVCQCGTTGNACVDPLRPNCLNIDGSAGTSGSLTVSCQCTPGGTTCGTGASATSPVCCSSTIPVGDPCSNTLPVGVCLACKGTSGSIYASGDNTSQGTCPTEGTKCQSNGSCI